MLLDFHHITNLSQNLLATIDIANFSIAEIINNTLVFAQNQAEIDQIDIMSDIVNAWQNFVKTGQSWAMLIGIFLGYAFRSFLP